MSYPPYVVWKKILLTFGTITGLLLVLSTFTVQNIQPPSLNEFQCDVSQHTGSDRFTIYLPGSYGAVPLAEHFCNRLLVNSQYRSVSIAWHPRSEFKAELLSTKPYQLIFSRHYFLQSVLLGYDSFYKDILRLPRYGVYWYYKTSSLQPNFHELSIGLLADPTSQSGYMEPHRYLTEHGYDLDSLKIQYFSNRDAMKTAFKMNLVDVIPVTSLNQHFPYWPADQKSLISNTAELGDWFIHNSVPQELSGKIRHSLITAMTTDSNNAD